MYFIAVTSHFTWQRVSRTLEVFGKEMFPEKGHEVEKSRGLVIDKGDEGGNMARHSYKEERDPQALC